jgi:hypothetical protein
MTLNKQLPWTVIRRRWCAGAAQLRHFNGAHPELGPWSLGR